MENLRLIIARNITELRREAGLTQLELAEKLNYSDKAVSKWERAESVPDIAVLKAVADLFGVTVDELISEKGITAVLVTTLTDELIEEGILREIVSKVQTMRKESGFEVTDNVVLGWNSNEEIIKKVFAKFESQIKKEVLAKEIKLTSEGEECVLNGCKVTLWVQKA